MTFSVIEIRISSDDALQIRPIKTICNKPRRWRPSKKPGCSVTQHSWQTGCNFSGIARRQHKVMWADITRNQVRDFCAIILVSPTGHQQPTAAATGTREFFSHTLVATWISLGAPCVCPHACLSAPCVLAVCTRIVSPVNVWSGSVSSLRHSDRRLDSLQSAIGSERHHRIWQAASQRWLGLEPATSRPVRLTVAHTHSLSDEHLGCRNWMMRLRQTDRQV